MYNKEYGKQYRLLHQEQIKKYNKQYNIDHREERNRYNKKYNQNNNMKEYRKQWELIHKNIRKEQFKKYRLKNREIYLISKYKNVDRKKNLICNLTILWLKENITNKPCFYCEDTNEIGCDRIDNTRGHTIDNVLPSCKICNIIRGFCNFTIEEMKLLGKTKKQIMILRNSQQLH